MLSINLKTNSEFHLKINVSEIKKKQVDYFLHRILQRVLTNSPLNHLALRWTLAQERDNKISIQKDEKK